MKTIIDKYMHKQSDGNSSDWYNTQKNFIYKWNFRCLKWIVINQDRRVTQQENKIVDLGGREEKGKQIHGSDKTIYQHRKAPNLDDKKCMLPTFQQKKKNSRLSDTCMSFFITPKTSLKMWRARRDCRIYEFQIQRGKCQDKDHW